MSGGRHRIVIAPYAPRWPDEFDAVAEQLRDALGDAAVSVDHIGSTSVPGLAAKDVIDVQISVLDLADLRLSDGFATLGAEDLGTRTDHIPPGQVADPAEWQKRMFRPPASWRPTHLHVRQLGRANQRYALLFRDFLRADAPAAAAYERVKVALARLHPDDVEAYYDVKDPVCDLVIQAAERWAAGRTDGSRAF